MVDIHLLDFTDWRKVSPIILFDFTDVGDDFKLTKF